MSEPIYNVLFLCTGNSARSILAEALIERWGHGRFRGFSAGSQPKGRVDPLAIELLDRMGLPTARLRSKSWEEFSAPGAPRLDFVITVCDSAARETCPVWPGQPMTAHWSVEDPAAVDGTVDERRAAFRNALRLLENRVRIFVDLPIASLDRMKLKQHLDEIGRTGADD
jgi:protein-tyrosine-phosphatase